MRYSLKCAGGIFLVGFLGLFMRPLPTLAADARCIRLSMNNPATPYHDYNPSNQRVRSLVLDSDVSLNWRTASPDKTSMVMDLYGVEKGQEILRFINPTTQRYIDYPLENAYVNPPYANTGWSPDGKRFAAEIYSYDTGPSLTVFSKDGTLVGATAYENTGGSSTWAWAPDNKQIALLQTHQNEDLSLVTSLSFFSLRGTIVEAKLDLSDLLSVPYLIWSPNGRLIALVEPTRLRIIDSTTGEAATVSQSAYIAQPPLDAVWSSDSRYLMYPTTPDWDNPSVVSVERYSVSEQASTVVIEDIHTSGDPYASVETVSIPKTASMLVRQDNEGMSHFLLIDALTGESQELFAEETSDASLNAVYQWSPLGDALWLAAKTVLVIRPDTITLSVMPDTSVLAGNFSTVHWSENGTWVGVLTENTSTNYSPWIIDTIRGEIREIPREGLYADVIPNNTGASLLAEYSTASLVSPDGSTTVLTDSIGSTSDLLGQSVATAWSSDGSRIAIVEIPPEADRYILKVMNSSGAPISSVEIPSEGDSIEALEWVPCG